MDFAYLPVETLDEKKGSDPVGPTPALGVGVGWAHT